MKLLHTQIPIDFLHTLPKGIKFFSRHGVEFLVVEQVTCPKGCTLMSDGVHIHNEPAIYIQVRVGNDTGFFFIDAYWGSHIKLSSFLPQDSDDPVVDSASCPTCGANLIVDESCTQEGCSAKKQIRFDLPGGENKIYICTKFHCPGHRIEIQSQPDEICKTVSNINYFGAHYDDFFRGI
jgi:hypothetical protein